MAKVCRFACQGVRIVLTYVLLKQSHIATYLHDLLAKNDFPVLAHAYLVRKRLTKKRILSRLWLSWLFSGKRKPININILSRTVSGTNRNRPWEKTGSVPGTNQDLSLGQTGNFLFNSTVRSPFCTLKGPWDGWGFVPGTIVLQGPSEKKIQLLHYIIWCFQIICLILQ